MDGWHETTTRVCPVCHEDYIPTHPSKAAAEASDDYESKEQWITGVCSTACWDSLFSPEER